MAVSLERIKQFFHPHRLENKHLNGLAQGKFLCRGPSFYPSHQKSLSWQQLHRTCWISILDSGFWHSNFCKKIKKNRLNVKYNSNIWRKSLKSPGDLVGKIHTKVWKSLPRHTQLIFLPSCAIAEQVVALWQYLPTQNWFSCLHTCTLICSQL